MIFATKYYFYFCFGAFDYRETRKPFVKNLYLLRSFRWLSLFSLLANFLKITGNDIFGMC